MEIEEVVGMAKGVCLKQDGEHVPQFMIEDKEGNWNMVVAPFGKDTKEMALDALKMMVEQMGSRHYFVVFAAWMLNNAKLEKVVKGKIKEALNDALSGQEDPDVVLKKRLEDLKERYSGSPSENDASDECLMVSEFRKGKEALTILIPILRENKKVSFGDEQSLHTESGSMTSIWNVWTPIQIDLDEKIERMKRKRGKKK